MQANWCVVEGSFHSRCFSSHRHRPSSSQCPTINPPIHPFSRPLPLLHPPVHSSRRKRHSFVFPQLCHFRFAVSASSHPDVDHVTLPRLSRLLVGVVGVVRVARMGGLSGRWGLLCPLLVPKLTDLGESYSSDSSLYARHQTSRNAQLHR